MEDINYRTCWAACYGATFSQECRQIYNISAQMGNASRFYGLSLAEIAEKDAYNLAEVSSTVADQAIDALRKFREENQCQINQFILDVRNIQDSSSFCGEFTDEQTAKLAQLTLNIVNSGILEQFAKPSQ